jgi:hypothetical protein
MGLLKSANNVQGVDFIDYRDTVYYNKYTYRARITVEGLRRGYYSDPEEFEERLNKNKLWGRISDKEKETIKQNLPEIKTLLQFRVDHKKDKQVTIRMEHDTMAVFHNDLDFLHKHFDGLVGAKIDFTQVETAGYAGVKLFAKQPKHPFRVYFRSKRVPAEFRESVKNILKSNPKLRPSPAFKIWLNSTESNGWRVWYHNYLSSSFFIDYTEESYLSYFALMHGEQLGKKYKLEKRPVIV